MSRSIIITFTEDPGDPGRVSVEIEAKPPVSGPLLRKMANGEIPKDHCAMMQAQWFQGLVEAYQSEADE